MSSYDIMSKGQCLEARAKPKYRMRWWDLSGVWRRVASDDRQICSGLQILITPHVLPCQPCHPLIYKPKQIRWSSDGTCLHVPLGSYRHITRRSLDMTSYDDITLPRQQPCKTTTSALGPLCHVTTKQAHHVNSLSTLAPRHLWLN